MEEKMNSLKKTARGAGILYIIMDVFMIFSGMVVDPKIYVSGDAVATASNILGYTLYLFLVLALYELFKSVDKGQARLMVILVVAGVSVAFLNTLNQYVPILLLSGAGHLSVFNLSQLQTLAMVFLDIFNHGVIIAQIFWGLWLIPLGLLVYKSGFIPKVLGVLLIVGCFGQLIEFLSIFLFPGYSTILTPIAQTAMIGELPIFLWLLIKGVKKDQHITTSEEV
jgi:hypothetical protein